MKTIVYLADGSIEATARADDVVASGVARYATPEEIRSYERAFARDDARIEASDVEHRAGYNSAAGYRD